MTICNNCQKELPTTNFCSDKCKMQMWRKVGKLGKKMIKRIDDIKKNANLILDKSTTPVERTRLIKKELNRPLTQNPFCKHLAMKGLCKMGCK